MGYSGSSGRQRKQALIGSMTRMGKKDGTVRFGTYYILSPVATDGRRTGSVNAAAADTDG